MRYEVGQKLTDKNTGKTYTVKRVNKNGTLRCTFWNRYDEEQEVTCHPREFA